MSTIAQPGNPQTAADLRVRAARSRTAIPAIPAANSQQTPGVSPPTSLPTPAHRR